MTQPQLGIAVFCEGSGPDAQGRDSIWGITDTVRMTVYGPGKIPPFKHRLLALIRVDQPGLKGQHSLRLFFEDSRGLRLPGEAVTTTEAQGEWAGWRTTCEVLFDVAEPRPGAYRLVVVMDGKRIGQIPLKLEIRRAPEDEAEPPGAD